MALRAIPITAGVILLTPLCLALVVFLRANGVTVSAAALASLPALVALLFIALPASPPRLRRPLGVAAAIILLLDCIYIAARLRPVAVSEPTVRFCEEGDCAATPPLASLLVGEGETALAGLYLSSSLGLIRGVEMDALEQILRAGYGDLASSPRFAGLPNAPLIQSDRGATRYLQWIPPGREKSPCLVFLHGFGGQLSLYMAALAGSELGSRFAIIAPFLDNTGRWWTPEGEAVVRDLVEHHLPSTVDRERVFLVGLSNGAVGATALAYSPATATKGATRGLFRGAILLSGVGNVPRGERAPADFLIITGAADPRFPIDAVRQGADAIRHGGAKVELHVIEGDHFVVLSRTGDVATKIAAWLGPRTLSN
jgi:predicted esterase